MSSHHNALLLSPLLASSTSSFSWYHLKAKFLKEWSILPVLIPLLCFFLVLSSQVFTFVTTLKVFLPRSSVISTLLDPGVISHSYFLTNHQHSTAYHFLPDTLLQLSFQDAILLFSSYPNCSFLLSFLCYFFLLFPTSECWSIIMPTPYPCPSSLLCKHSHLW